MKKDVEYFIAKCPRYHLIKVEYRRPVGLTQVNDVPTWKWEEINMDFVVGLSRICRQNDSTWIIMDKLMKSAHFVPIKSTYSV